MFLKTAIRLSVATVFCSSLVALAAPPKVFFESPKDGATVTQETELKFGVMGMTVAPAGQVKPNEGHHHVIVDGGPAPKGTVITKDATHIHYGDGATSAKIKLAPGPHTLTLQFADGSHSSYGPEMSQTIKVNVK